MPDIRNRMRRDRVAAAAVQMPDKGALCICACLCYRIIKVRKEARILSGASLYCQNSLPGCRNHLLLGKVPADPMRKPQTLQSGCRQQGRQAYQRRG